MPVLVSCLLVGLQCLIIVLLLTCVLLSNVIDCAHCAVGVASMQKNEKCILKCAPSYAYGTRGVPGSIPPNSTLYFEVELLGWDTSDNLAMLRHILTACIVLGIIAYVLYG
jgi:FKBP-type peptidyl-prolyl cis-trans isomerase